MNDWNALTYTLLTIKSRVYEAFLNPEESVCFTHKFLRIDSYIYTSVMNASQCFSSVSVSVVSGVHCVSGEGSSLQRIWSPSPRAFLH